MATSPRSADEGCLPDALLARFRLMVSWSRSWVAAATVLASLTGRVCAQTALPAVDVIGQTPLPGSDIARDKSPGDGRTLSAPDFDGTKSWSLPDTLLLRVPGVTLNDVTGNPFQPDLQYRGFVASPVLGTPQGLAIYQNGVRVNEVFGDIVNWDFIPQQAIDRANIVSNNPVFGLNALGGALALTMKNGFGYHGAEAELRGGFFGRRAGTVQAGGQQGAVSGYITADALDDDGWRDHSPSRLRRVYADIGARTDASEFHLNFTGAANEFGAAAATPIELLNQRWQSVFTTPQTTRNELAFWVANGKSQLSDALTLEGNLYLRNFRQRHVDGNTAEFGNCAPANGFLCIGDDLLTASGGAPIAALAPGAVPGSLDRTATSAQSFGGTLQATATGQWMGHGNRLVVGSSVDRGNARFMASSEVGTIGSDLFVTGTGVTISSPDAGIAPVDLISTTTYTGIYATDTFDVTSALAVTAGGRFNVAQIRLDDQLGGGLDGSHQFSRFNPVIGATYRIQPSLVAYAGYSEANRAPTPTELGCADPAHPCLLDNFLTSDPALKQVVARTIETGLRGEAAAPFGRLTFALGLFRTDTADDIISVASPIPGRGFFQNAGTTRRQGAEASASYRASPWVLTAGYSYVDATFRDALTLSSPNNPAAIDGLIAVTPGDRIPLVPLHRLKGSIEYAANPQWTLAADLVAVGSQYLQGDASNQNPKIPAYWTVNLRTSYQVSPRVELFGLLQNAFNQRYYTYGTFFDPALIPSLNLSDPRTLVPGAPLAAYAGLRARW
ncbi:MAG TPA: TonB-dependent receptor [Xanthobacteraceae bacterium]|nr:TonB-dependent receptor [Xanthobacteraceae bacterium]